VASIETTAAPGPPRVGPPGVVPVALAARQTGALRLRLNIPAFRLDLLVDSAVDGRYGVAVGMRRYRTPIGAFAVHRVVWNPWWIPPDSPWAAKDTVTPPGPTNPMGRVKLLLDGPYYMHGTPFTASIGSAASHGCIRLRNADAIALAMRLQTHAGVGPDSLAVARLALDTASLAVDLPSPVPIDIVYELAELRGDTLVLHPDVYRRAAGRIRTLALLSLAEAGYDTSRVWRARLARALTRARTRHVAVPLDSLLRHDALDRSQPTRSP
jgi:murein L,D-transpeptidase YcbB/YkuD